MAVKLTREAVEQAIAECDAMGRKAFLAKYGFAGARDYFLSVNGRNYDSKAIVAVANKYMPGGTALEHDDLRGGVGDAAKQLRSLGFEIMTPAQNADWSWDEHVLALDLYMQFPTSPPGKTSQTILDLSALLNVLGERRGVVRTEKFRNANGVYMKLMNFRRFDPAFHAQGKAGLSQGSAMEARVWDRYQKDRLGLVSAATAIRLAIADSAVDLTVRVDDDEYEAEEGAVVLRLHRSRERDPKLAEKKKRQALARGEKLECEACRFDFERAYGRHGRGFIEVHHRKPVSTLIQGEKTKLSDLALVCSNCHRMLHRGALLSTDELSAMLTAAAAH